MVRLLPGHAQVPVETPIAYRAAGQVAVAREAVVVSALYDHCGDGVADNRHARYDPRHVGHTAVIPAQYEHPFPGARAGARVVTTGHLHGSQHGNAVDV